MRRYVGWSGAVVLLVLGAVGLSSCGGGGGGNSTNSEPAPRTPQFVFDPVGTTSNAGSLTMGVSKAGLDANRADRITVVARLLDPDRRPLVGAAVEFRADFLDAQVLPEAPGLSQGSEFPRSAPVLTDGEGVASVTVVAPGEAGRMAIVAATSRNLRLGGLIFVNVYDVGYIPSPDDQSGPVMIPSEISITDPTAGAQLQFVVIGGTPFTGQNQPPAAANVEPDVGFVFADPEAAAQETPPYLLENASSGIGVAELVFNGRFPATVLYTVGGRVAGAHTFGAIDADGERATGTVTADFSVLSITPESAPIEVGSSQAFALTGGVPPYTCTPSGGTLTPTTINERGGTTVFRPTETTRDATFTVLCRDQSGQTVSATVSVKPLPTASPEPSGTAGPPPTPTPAPREPTRVELSSVPPTLNGPDGGVATVTARVLDQDFAPLAGVPVIFTLPGQTGEPTPTVPSINPTVGTTDGNGQVSTLLTVPAGTAPQFLTITGETDNEKSGTVQIGITSQTTTPSGPPARISAAVLRADACQVNQNGSLTAIISALVSDDNGNPVSTGVPVDWGPVTPVDSADVINQSFTNAAVPCLVDQYHRNCDEDDIVLTISPQPGTATTCFTYDLALGGQTGSVTATVAGTGISTTTQFTLPRPPVQPPPTPTPVVEVPPTPSPGPPSIAPGFANLETGQNQNFAVSGGVPPYNVSASGGTASPATVLASGGTFNYQATSEGNFTILVSDSNGQVASASVTNTAGSVIKVDREGPLNVALLGTEDITITSGGTPPYTITLTGGLSGSLTPAAPLDAPGTFSFTATDTPSTGQILITDGSAPPNTRSITISVP